MLAACLGRERGAEITDLTNLLMGVRIDQPGTLIDDYHTISRTDGSTLPTASGANKKDITAVTKRWYLADAVFLVTLTGDKSLLCVIARAIDNPVYAPTLGRRSCVPTGRLNLGVHDRDAETLLAEWPWEAGAVQVAKHAPTPTLDATIEDPNGDDLIADVPNSYAPLQRRFGNRRIRHSTVQPPNRNPETVAPQQRDHDAFELLEP
jgi:CRISPR system Cascade subunit CasD